jgi:hypothetical protein
MSEFLEAVSSGTITPELLQVSHLTCLQCCGSGSAWIRIRLKGRFRIRIKVTRRIRIRIKVTSRIRIRIKVMPIRNTAYLVRIA